MREPLNLARRPFLNTRPVVRISAALVIVGAILAGINVWLYWGAFSGREERREHASEVARQIAEEQRRVATAREALQSLNLREQNQRVDYLNRRIAERTFPWSHLFEELADVLPDRVRLLSLAPHTSEPSYRPGRRTGQGPIGETRPRTRLEIRAVAESSDGMLVLIDNLFASPIFERPSLPRESRQSDGTIQFVLSVEYLPSLPAPAEVLRTEGLDAAGDELEMIAERGGIQEGGRDAQPWQAGEASPDRASRSAGGRASAERASPGAGGRASTERASPGAGARARDSEPAAGSVAAGGDRQPGEPAARGERARRPEPEPLRPTATAPRVPR